MIITGKKFSKPKLSRVINGDDELVTDAAPTTKTRLDHFLVSKYPDFNRSSLQKFIKNGLVKVDGKTVTKPNTLLAPEAKVDFTPPAPTAPAERPPVIFENAQVLVLDKPAGMLSMAKGAYCPETTLEHFGLLVHRLDRDTSGVVILAKDAATQSFLRRQFQERKTHKTYFAVVHGRPKQDRALIDLPINRNFKRPNTFIVDAGGKSAQTYYEVIATNGIYSLVKLQPRTGRTHQLRVHLNYIGTPIVGDPVYGTAEDIAAANAATSRAALPRMFLHAESLEITLPNPDGANQRRTFHAPLSHEFIDFFKKSGTWLTDLKAATGEN